MQVEEIKPYGEQGAKHEQVREMFDNIAPAYDTMNHAMTFGIDRWWRRCAVRRVAHHLKLVLRVESEEWSSARGENLNSPLSTLKTILDIATGTGDFALALSHKCAPCHIIGVDLSEGMLKIAREKAEKAGIKEIEFMQGDCLQLPFDEGIADAVTIAFGVRNFEQLLQGYQEMWRVLRKGGMLCVLELSTPRNRITRWCYDIYTRRIIPLMGEQRSGDREAYTYLPRSIAAAPQGDDMLALMRQAGFDNCQCRRMTFGTCSMYLALKP